MARKFGEREIATEAAQMSLILDYLLQEIKTGKHTQNAGWDSRAIAQMSCEIYRKLSNS